MARTDKFLAMNLRAQRKSYKQISKELAIPRSTLHEWFKDLNWSKQIKHDLDLKQREASRIKMAAMSKKLSEYWLNFREQKKLEAIREFDGLKENKLFLVGLMLYWAEGDNGEKTHQARLTNTDARMIKIFIRFATEFCGVNRNNIKFGLILYPDLDEIVSRNFWKKYLEVEEHQFYKVQYIKGKHPTKRLANGICVVYIGALGVKIKIKTWIDFYANNLMRV
jgi:hypothetical protein